MTRSVLNIGSSEIFLSRLREIPIAREEIEFRKSDMRPIRRV